MNSIVRIEPKQNFLNSLKTLSELETWATANNCTDDPEVNLKRIELLTPRVTAHPVSTPVSSIGNICHICQKSFKQRQHLARHIRTVHGIDIITCEECKHTFTRRDNLENHRCNLKRKSTPTGSEPKHLCLHPLSPDNTPATRLATCNRCGHVKCLLPGKLFCQQCSTKGRECLHCLRPLPERFSSQQVNQCDSCVRRRERYQVRRSQIGGGQRSALEGNVSTTALTPNEANSVNILQFIADEQTNITPLLHDFLLKKKGMKWFLTLKLKFIKYDENNESILAEPIVRTINFWATQFSEIEQQLAEAYQKLYTSTQEFQAEGSGWLLDHIVHVEVNTAEYAPLAASSYISLPEYLANKKAIFNIQNDDQKCFMWSILAALHPVHRKNHAERVNKYNEYEHELDLKGIDIPVPFSQISKFENRNKISVNVFGFEKDDGVFPLYISSNGFKPAVDLLLLSQGDNRHFCLIRSCGFCETSV